MANLVRIVLVVLLAVVIGCGGEKPKPKSKTTKKETLSTSTGEPTDEPKEDNEPDEKKEDAKTPASDADSVTEALRLVGSNEADRRLKAIRALAVAEYDPEVGEEVVASLVKRLTSSVDGDEAVNALATWARVDDVPLVKGLLGRQQNEIRHRAIVVLGTIGGFDAAEAIAGRLTSAFDRELALKTLKTMGTDAEQAVLPLAEDRDKEVRRAVVLVLHDVGTAAESGEVLLEMTMDPDVATEAAKALDAVESR